jgi:hypothetical protein
LVTWVEKPASSAQGSEDAAEIVDGGPKPCDTDADSCGDEAVAALALALLALVPIGPKTQEAFALVQRTYPALPCCLGHQSFCEWHRSHDCRIRVGPGIVKVSQSRRCGVFQSGRFSGGLEGNVGRGKGYGRRSRMRDGTTGAGWRRKERSYDSAKGEFAAGPTLG